MTTDELIAELLEFESIPDMDESCQNAFRRARKALSALSGIADPAAFVKAARELADRADWIHDRSDPLHHGGCPLCRAAKAFRASDVPK